MNLFFRLKAKKSKKGIVEIMKNGDYLPSEVSQGLFN